MLMFSMFSAAAIGMYVCLIESVLTRSLFLYHDLILLLLRLLPGGVGNLSNLLALPSITHVVSGCLATAAAYSRVERSRRPDAAAVVAAASTASSSRAAVTALEAASLAATCASSSRAEDTRSLLIRYSKPDESSRNLQATMAEVIAVLNCNLRACCCLSCRDN